MTLRSFPGTTGLFIALVFWPCSFNCHEVLTCSSYDFALYFYV